MADDYGEAGAVMTTDDELIEEMLVAYYSDDAPIVAVDAMRAALAVVRAHDRDGERYRFITEDHADSSVRAKIRELLNRLPVMSYAAASAAIDAAMRGEK